jgi:hypothetical protein
MSRLNKDDRNSSAAVESILKKKPFTSKATKAARVEARRARMVPVILRKLEGSPGVHAQQVLNADEFDEAALMIRSAVQFINDYIAVKVKAGKTEFHLPSRFKWRTTWLDLMTSNLDRVFIVSKSGAPVIASGYGAIL